MDGAVDVRAETTAAFIGRALRGPLNSPVLVTSFAAFKRRFGGTWSRSSLGPAVEQFFEHGGRQLYIVRVANNARGAMICIPAVHGVLVLKAVEPGASERIRASVDYDGIDADDVEHFNLTLQRIAPDSGLVADQEIYRRLSCNENDARFIGNAMAASELAFPQMPLPGGRPVSTDDSSSLQSAGYVGHAQAGTDGEALSDYDLIGSSIKGTALFALDQVERFELLYMPPPTPTEDVGPAAILAAELYCRRRGAMLLLDPSAGWNSAAAAIEGIRTAAYAGPNLVSYFPRLCHAGNPLLRPAGGALAGLLAGLDRRYGPWESLEQKNLTFRQGLVPGATLAEEDVRRLVREGLNVIRARPNRSATIEGSVTLARNAVSDRQFQSLGVRRLCLAITNAVERATRWAVFEADETRVAERVRAQVHACLASLADSGAFADDRFIVQCEAGPQVHGKTPERGVTILLVFRPLPASEPISLTLHQSASGCRVATTAFAPAASECA